VGVKSVAALHEHFGEVPRTAPLAYRRAFAARPITEQIRNCERIELTVPSPNLTRSIVSYVCYDSLASPRSESRATRGIRFRGYAVPIQFADDTLRARNRHICE